MFTFEVAETTTVQMTVTTSGSGGLNRPVIEIFDPDRQMITSKFASSSDPKTVSVIVNNLEPGQYFARVKPVSFGNTGTYTLSSQTFYDISDSFDDAASILLDDPISSAIESGDTGDMFVLTTYNQRDINFRVAGSGMNDLDGITITAYDAGHVSLGTTSASSGKTAGLMLNDAPAGTYYLRVKGSTASKVGDYTIIADGSYDIPNTLAGAEPLALNTPTESDITYGDDGDMFKVVLGSPSDLSFRAEGSGVSELGRITIRAYDAGNVNIGSDSSSGGGIAEWNMKTSRQAPITYT